MAKLDCDLFKSGCEGLELYEEIDTKLIGATKSVKGAVLHNPDTTDSIQYRIYVYGTSAGRSPPQFHSENNNRKVIIARTLKSVDKAIEFAGEMDAKLLEFYQTLKR